MGFIADTGRKTLQFGLVLFVLAHFYVFLMADFGFPVLPFMENATIILPAIDLGVIVSSAIYIIGKQFVPQLAQAFSYGVYLSLFVPAAYAIATTVMSLMVMLPIPAVISGSLASFTVGFLETSMLYYLATRVSGLPPE